MEEDYGDDEHFSDDEELADDLNEEEEVDEEEENSTDPLGVDEEAEVMNKMKKRKTDMVSNFIDAEAVVDRGDEDEEDEEGFGEDDFISNEEHSEKPSRYRETVSANAARTAAEQSRAKRKDLITDLTKRYVQDKPASTYQEELEEVEDDMGAEEDERIAYDSLGSGYDRRKTTEHRILPDSNDPKLFMVKCIKGKEREAVITLMQKFFDHERSTTADKTPLEIKTAFTLDHFKGYVYIEADKALHVKQAIKGITLLSEIKMKLVPLEEMTKLFSSSKKDTEFKEGTMVKVRRGLYKDDMGTIEGVDEARGVAVIKLLPRIDWNAYKDGEPQPQDDANSKSKTRPAQKLITEGDRKRLKIDATTSRDPLTRKQLYTWDGKKFSLEGYLYKPIGFKGIDTRPFTPDMETYQKYFQGSTGDSTAMDKLSRTLILNKKLQFNKGDEIVVAEGDLKGIMGSIDEIDAKNNIVTFTPQNQEIKQKLQVQLSQLRKHFAVGTFCRVISGKHEGESGYIVQMEGDTITLFNETKNLEIKAFVSEIQKASEVSSNAKATFNTLGAYELHDFIKIDANTCGMITVVEKDVLKVLDSNGTVRTLKVQEVGGKLRAQRDIKIPDRNNVQIGVEDSIRVIEGSYKGKNATVLFIFRNQILFCHSREVVENGGNIVVKAKAVEIRGGQTSKQGAFVVPLARPPPRYASRARINDTVKITDKDSPYKGYIGTVRGFSGPSVRVELHSMFKTVSIASDKVMRVDDHNNRSGGNNSSMSMNTPSNAPSTPFDRYGQTPLRDGGETPMHDGFSETPSRTPSHDAWNPRAANTPARDSWSSNDNSGPYSSSTSGMTSSSIQTPGVPQTVVNSYPPVTPRIADTPHMPLQSPMVPHGSVITPHPGTALPSDLPQTPNIPTQTPSIVTPGFGMQHSVVTPMIGQGTGVGGMNIPTPMLPGNSFSTPSIVTPYGMTPQQQQQQQYYMYMQQQQQAQGSTMADWIEIGIGVDILDTTYKGYKGFIKQVNPREADCIVDVINGPESFEIDADKLKPSAVEKKGTAVKVIRGEYKGQIGDVTSIDDSTGDCVIKFHRDKTFQFVNVKDIALFRAPTNA